MAGAATAAPRPAPQSWQQLAASNKIISASKKLIAESCACAPPGEGASGGQKPKAEGGPASGGAAGSPAPAAAAKRASPAVAPAAAPAVKREAASASPAAKRAKASPKEKAPAKAAPKRKKAATTIESDSDVVSVWVGGWGGHIRRMRVGCCSGAVPQAAGPPGLLVRLWGGSWCYKPFTQRTGQGSSSLPPRLSPTWPAAPAAPAAFLRKWWRRTTRLMPTLWWT